MKQWIAAAVLAITGCGSAWATPLLDAASANDEAAVATLLAQGANVNELDWDGSTALMWAVSHQNEALVRRLIASGANVTQGNNFGMFPLWQAVQLGNAAIVDLLITNGADADTRTGNATSPTMLTWAVYLNFSPVVKVLLEHGADPDVSVSNFPLVVWAASHKSGDSLRWLIEYGADLSYRTSTNTNPGNRPMNLSVVSAAAVISYPNIENRGGVTLALIAARDGCASCIQWLAAAGVDLDQSDPNGITPLIMAAINLQFDTVIELVKYGADPNLWDWWGRTPLYSVVDVLTPPRGGRIDLPNIRDQATGLDALLALLEAGADPNFQLIRRVPFRNVMSDRGCDQLLAQGATPLLRAAKTFETDAMRLLLQYGAIVDLPQLMGITPLMAAAGGGSWDCDPRGGYDSVFSLGGGVFEARAIASIQLLLEHGADINARMWGPYGDFPEYRIAFETEGLSRQEIAAREAAGQTYITRNGQTALHWAAFWGWSDVVKFLAQNGGDLLAQDVRGMTPYDAALGRAGGNGFAGNTFHIFSNTAALIDSLIAAQTAAANTR